MPALASESLLSWSRKQRIQKVNGRHIELVAMDVETMFPGVALGDFSLIIP